VSPHTGIAIGFFTSTAAGVLAGLLLTPREELGRFFSALNAALAFACFCLVAPFRPDPLGRTAAGARGQEIDVLASLAAGLAMALTAAFIVSLYLPAGRGGRGVMPGGRRGKWLLVLAAAAALGATALDGWGLARGGASAFMSGAGALAAAALLGSVIVAMILGHWYLVRLRLPERHLVRFSRILGGAVLLRALVLIAGIVIFGAAAPGGVGAFLRQLAVDRGLFFWQRIFFGILGPAAFSYMAYETSRIRSTQSATGILYIAVVFVVIGEFLARYLAAAGAGPV
jgi:hypothetical protein